jgi:hypothetical protein
VCVCLCVCVWRSRASGEDLSRGTNTLKSEGRVLLEMEDRNLAEHLRVLRRTHRAVDMQSSHVDMSTWILMAPFKGKKVLLRAQTSKRCTCRWSQENPHFNPTPACT